MIVALLLAATAAYAEPVFPQKTAIPATNTVQLTVGELRAREQASYAIGYTNAFFIVARAFREGDWWQRPGVRLTEEQAEVFGWLSGVVGTTAVTRTAAVCGTTLSPARTRLLQVALSDGNLRLLRGLDRVMRNTADVRVRKGGER